MKLLISQKDELFNLIERTDFLTPSQFNLTEKKQKDSEYITELTLKESDYFFRFIPESSYQGLFFANFSPGNESVIQATEILSWNSGLVYVENWLYFLKRELTAANKWERLFQEIKSVHLIPTSDQTKFTYQEYTELIIKINQIKDSLSSISLLKDQQEAIITQLDHLTDLAKEMNKFDWKSLFIGTLISIIIQLYVTKENASKLWDLIKGIFSNYFLP